MTRRIVLLSILADYPVRQRSERLVLSSLYMTVMWRPDVKHSFNPFGTCVPAQLKGSFTKRTAYRGDAPDFVEVGEAGIAVGHAMRR